MGEIWVRQFSGGLDSRRLPETTPGGSLILARDGHINRGGEFEQRAAFVPEFTLPAGTTGLSFDDYGIYVFGSGAQPAGMPAGVTYQQLQHPTDATIALWRVLSTDLYKGKIYAVGLFADGSIQHFYDGAHVADWVDGRARGAFSITGGHSNPAASASASFAITGGTQATGNSLLNITLPDGTLVLGTAVGATGDNSRTAAAVAAAIGAAGTGFTATSSDATVTVTSIATGPALNGVALNIAVSGDFTVGNQQAFSGGADAETSRLTGLTVDGVSIINSGVDWSGSNEQMAADIADAINNTKSNPQYVAAAIGNKVAILSSTAGTTPNGKLIAFTFAYGLTISNDQLALANGAATAAGSPTLPADAVRTVGSKVYGTGGPLLNFSGVGAPAGWNTTNNTGAGFIDMSAQASGAEKLKAVGEYAGMLAVFALRVILIEYIDPNPANNKVTQTLRNTGTVAPRSVVGFGDQDLFYLDRSGLRSLRARYASQAAATTDIGVPVDTLLIAKLRSLNSDEQSRITAEIEPRDNRFWLAFSDEIFVFSYFTGSKVSSWSTYTPSYVDANGVVQTFTIDDTCVFDKGVYVRSGNTIFLYGGKNGDTYDAIEPEVWLPYLDAEKPAVQKTLDGIDVACRGTWEVRVGMDPQNLNATDKIAVIKGTTYSEPDIGSSGEATHFSLRLKGIGGGYKVVSSAMMHYTADDDED